MQCNDNEHGYGHVAKKLYAAVSVAQTESSREDFAFASGMEMRDQAVKDDAQIMATEPPMEECASDMGNEPSVQSRWCINQAIKRELSIRLGARKKPKQCSNDGCTNKVCNIIT